MLEQCSLIRLSSLPQKQMVANVLYLWGNLIKKSLKDSSLETVLAWCCAMCSKLFIGISLL